MKPTPEMIEAAAKVIRPYSTNDHEIAEAALQAALNAMCQQPLDSMPREGYFLAQHRDKTWHQVQWYNNPFGHETTVINNKGRWFAPIKWMPLP